MGKTVYLTDLQIELIQLAFDVGNYSFEKYGEEEEIRRTEAAEDLLRKVTK